jgi:competence protein ComEA
MYKFYRWIYDLMGFSRSQANGFLIFLPLLIIIVLSEPIYRAWLIRQPVDRANDIKTLDSLVALWSPIPTDSVQISTPPKLKRRLDPNTATMTEFLGIGLPEMLAGRIISYRRKGGSFRSSAELKKIYGMDSALLANIGPYLTFPKRQTASLDSPSATGNRKIIAASILKFDLNHADTTQLKKIQGIGSKLSLRIVKYRDALGGFLSTDQLAEIYRLDTSVVAELKRRVFVAPAFEPAKLNINTSSEEQLARHPYLEKNEASAIVAYRFKHGKFISLNDLAGIKVLDTTSIRRMIPYLECK